MRISDWSSDVCSSDLHVRPGPRIVGLLRFPGDQPVLDVDLPTARSGAVGAVRRADDLIVLPALPVAVLPAPVLVRHDAVTVREFPDGLLEEHQPIDEVRHELPMVRGPLFSISVQAGPAVPG